MDVHLTNVRTHEWSKLGLLVKNMNLEWGVAEHLDNQARVIAGRLDNGDALFNDYVGISYVVGRVYCREQCDIHTKRFGSHCPATPDPVWMSNGGKAMAVTERIRTLF
jgi:hypothetical protein